MTPGTIAYPSALDSYTTLLRLGLGTETTLKRPLAAADTDLWVANASLLATPDGVLLVESEWITYTAISGNNITGLGRGAFSDDGGYPAKAHPDGARVAQIMTPMHHRVLADAVIALERSVRSTLGPFVLNDVPGTATTELLLPYMNTSTAWSQGGANDSSRLRMPTAGQVVAAFLTSDAARTAGTATLQVTINGTPTAFAAGACVLNGTDTRNASAYDAAGLAFAAGDDLGVAVVTSGWTPTTADMNAWLTVRLGT